MVFTEGDKYKLNIYGKEYFVHLKKYFIDKAKVNLWWAEADEGVVIPGWSKTASKRSGLLLGKEDEVEKQLKQNGLVLVVSEWKGGSRYKKTRRRRRQTRRLHSNLVKRKNKLTHPR
jgi:hypothetical protein